MFLTDIHTVNDLNLSGGNSVASIFNRASCYGGKMKMASMFRQPLCDPETVSKRIAAIRFFQLHETGLDIQNSTLDFIEHYLSRPDVPSRPSIIDGIRKGVRQWIKPTNDRYVLTRGISLLSELVGSMAVFAADIAEAADGTMLSDFASRIGEIIDNKELKRVVAKGSEKLSFYDIERFDSAFRYSCREEIRELLDMLYQIDVYSTLGRVATERGFALPEIREADGIEIEGLYHPLLENPVRNDFFAGPGRNVFLVTGSNMSGKSTLLKAFGISVYLAHMGFPVPAEKMTLSLFDGLFTTINLGDDVGSGYSHFYAEVRRIKNIALHLRERPNLIVIFDEIFRGTNFIDAMRATYAVIEAFASKPAGVFIFSSHLVEVVGRLDELRNVHCVYLESRIEEEDLKFTYILRQGISDDRFGMHIVEKEQLVKLIKNGPADKND